MDQLINVINKLQDVFHTVGSESIQLPQIVVVGTQSAGKSSVLENIVGRTFLPRGTGIVTRTALILQLVHAPMDDMRHRSNADGTADVEEFGKFLHSDKIFFDFNEIREEIEAETDRITGTNKGISSDQTISLRIFSPHVVNLTLVDLPGLTKVPVGDQPADIEHQIKDLVLKYIENPNSIIMAIVTANTDMATNESLKLAKDCDPEGDRTLAVVTKIDLMDAGTDAHDILSGKVIPVKLGIIAVINRSQKDINEGKSIADALRDEAIFLQHRYPALSDRNGTVYLRQKLNKLLMKHIRSCLPDLKRRVQLLTSEHQSLLDAYGEEITDKDEFMLRVIHRLSQSYCQKINGCTSDLMASTLVGGAKICHIFHHVFKSSIDEIDPLENLGRNEVLTMIRNANGPRPSLFIPESALITLINRQIAKLQAPSITCCDLVYDEMQLMIERCIEEMESMFVRFPRLRDRMLMHVSELLRDRKGVACNMILNLIEIEKAYFNTRHPHFAKEKAMGDEDEDEDADDDDNENRYPAYPGGISINKSRIGRLSVPAPSMISNNRVITKAPSSQSMDNKQTDKVEMTEAEAKDCMVIEKLLQSYFSTVQTNIYDLVTKTIMCFLVNYVQDNIRNTLTSKLYKEPSTDDLFSESKHIATQRNIKKEMLIGLNKASIIINEIRDTHI